MVNLDAVHTGKDTWWCAGAPSTGGLGLSLEHGKEGRGDPVSEMSHVHVGCMGRTLTEELMGSVGRAGTHHPHGMGKNRHRCGTCSFTPSQGEPKILDQTPRGTPKFNFKSYPPLFSKTCMWLVTSAGKALALYMLRNTLSSG